MIRAGGRAPASVYHSPRAAEVVGCREHGPGVVRRPRRLRNKGATQQASLSGCAYMKNVRPFLLLLLFYRRLMISLQTTFVVNVRVNMGSSKVQQQ